MAVPVGLLSSYRRIRPHCDVLITLKVVEEISFAVASFYDALPDLSDDADTHHPEAKMYLRGANRTSDAPQEHPTYIGRRR